MDLIETWRKNRRFRNFTLLGGISFLTGCLAYWGLKEIEAPRYASLLANGLFKGIALALWLDAIAEYNKSRKQ